jgi:hypothetical protein
MAGTIRRGVVLAAGILAGFAVGYAGALLVLGTDETRACVIALAIGAPLLALFARELIGMWNGVEAQRRPPREFTPVVDPELADVSLWEVRRQLDPAVER